MIVSVVTYSNSTSVCDLLGGRGSRWPSHPSVNFYCAM